MTPPTRRARMLVALLVGGFWGWYGVIRFAPGHVQASDFTQIWLAAHAVVERREPYSAVLAWEQARGYVNQLGLYYPLPAAILGLPFVPLRPEVAGPAFVAASFALGAYAVTRERWFPLAAFAGPAAFRTVQDAQLGGVLLAAMWLPRACGWTVVMKPTVGLAGWLWRPSWAAFIGGAAVVAGSLAVDPTWPGHWYATVRGSPYAVVAVTRAWFAPILLLALLRWRTREGRLLLALACVPHSMFWCDEMLLGAIPRTLRQAYLSTVAGWIAFLAFIAVDSRASPNEPLQLGAGFPWLIAGVYVPALVSVLSSPNSGAAPRWLERTLARWRVPAWLRGTGG
jgi:hypothetical protein